MLCYIIIVIHVQPLFDPKVDHQEQHQSVIVCMFMITFCIEKAFSIGRKWDCFSFKYFPFVFDTAALIRYVIMQTSIRNQFSQVCVFHDHNIIIVCNHVAVTCGILQIYVFLCIVLIVLPLFKTLLTMSINKYWFCRSSTWYRT